MQKIGTVVQNFKGLDVFPTGANVNVRAIPTTSGKIILVVQKGQRAGTTTGNVNKMIDGDWWQIKTDSGVFGYVRSDVAKAIKPKPATVTDAKDIIESLVESDKKVFDVLNKVQLFLLALKSKGNDTSKYDNSFVSLSKRLTTRQDAIKSSTVIKWQAGIKEAFAKSQQSYINLLQQTNGDAGMFMAGIGALPVAIIVAVTFGAGLAATAYFIFKPKYDESKTDLKISSELENLLSKTDPATSTKIKNDLEKQIDTAYNQGNTDGTFGGMLSLIKPLAIGLLGFWLVTKFISKNK